MKQKIAGKRGPLHKPNQQAHECKDAKFQSALKIHAQLT
jgi:hypothetical protein